MQINSLINILIALVVFGLLVAIHELGHFTVAKLSGIRVNKFAIGMGPRIIKFTKGETEYSLRLLPIGGFCSMEGEDSESDDERAFLKKPVGSRIAVVAAGAIMNIILGFIIAVIITCMMEKIPTTTVAKFDEGAMSEQCGLQAGDEILKMNGTTIFTSQDIMYELNQTKDGIFDVVVRRDGKKTDLGQITFYDQYYYYVDKENNKYVTFETPEEYTGDEELQVAEDRFDFYVTSIKSKNAANVLSYSAKYTVTLARLIWKSLIDLVTGQYGLNDLSGPVGIVSAIGEVRSYGLESLLQLVALISINLGIFNLLPLPALDGGRLVFLIIEAIRRKPVPPDKEGMVHFVGMALLMLLMVVITISDIKKLI
ncbi:MAG: RIP metalloprotease RseP [Oscillospiraceae bacterium]|nr:RIP metalloprotease RseP [Oscillospiraceae bacterium]